MFKVGDRVRIIRSVPNSPHDGEEGVIEDMEGMRYGVRLPHIDEFKWWYKLEDLELLVDVEETSKTPCEELGYKVGDKFTLNDCAGKWFLKGQTVVLSRDDGSHLPYFSHPCEDIIIALDIYGDITPITKPGTLRDVIKKESVKYDEGKPIMDLIDPSWERGVAEVLTFGARKYAPDNWKGLDANRVMSSLLRHINAYRGGEELDVETGKSHLLHASCCLMMLNWMEEENDE